MVGRAAPYRYCETRWPRLIIPCDSNDAEFLFGPEIGDIVDLHDRPMGAALRRGGSYYRRNRRAHLSPSAPSTIQVLSRLLILRDLQHNFARGSAALLGRKCRAAFGEW